MFCPQCGREYSQKVNFCCHCGAAMFAPARLNNKKLTLSRRDKKIAGVCGGFAEYLELDPTLVRLLWVALAFYKGSYAGQYCFSDELYVDSAKPGDPCPICGRPTETVEEENYFFKLSAFQEKLLELYANPEFIRPETRRNEVISFVKSGLRDLSISRSTFSWGIPVPDDPKHVIYVWLDALANYITAIGYGSAHAGAQEAFKKFWPADVQMIDSSMSRPAAFASAARPTRNNAAAKTPRAGPK